MPFPTGLIILWSGAIVDIPAGYVLCDGNNGTPDLRNQFVVGAGDTYAVGANGGNIVHSHGFTGNGHSHSIGGGAAVGGGTDFATGSSSDPTTGTTQAQDGRPPYYSLAYIMKT